MHFVRAHAHNFRLLKDFSIELHPELNFVVGGNGAGKTTLLEALYVIGRGSSYRAASALLATDGENDWSLAAKIRREPASGPDGTVNVRYSQHRVLIEINHQGAAVSELVRLLPVLVIDPLAHRLVEEGPAIRRRFLDWGVFHMERSFLEVWKRMTRALKQRNAALRQELVPTELAVWNRELAGAAEVLTTMRNAYVERLREAVKPYWQRLLGRSDWQLNLLRGWRNDDYYAALSGSYEADRRAGHTREGPHRAELQILGDNKQLRERVSRGEQKLLVAGLVLAQSDMYALGSAERPALLIDDFSAELSQSSQRKFLDVLMSCAGQKIISALEYSDLFKGLAGQSVFHVEHGQVTTKI